MTRPIRPLIELQRYEFGAVVTSDTLRFSAFCDEAPQHPDFANPGRSASFGRFGANRKPFLAVHAPDALVVHDPALPAQQRIATLDRGVVQHLAIDLQNVASAPFADVLQDLTIKRQIRKEALEPRVLLV